MCSLYQPYLNMSIFRLSFSYRYFAKIVFLFFFCKIFFCCVFPFRPFLYNKKKKDITKMTGRMLMGLHFIFGAAGTGKTRRCCEEIRDYVTGKKGRSAFFLVPDQETYTAERMLADIFPGHGFIDATVCGFSRLAYRVFNGLRSLCKMLFLRWASRSSSAASLRNTGMSCKCS